jgi:hypothetical protein
MSSIHTELSRLERSLGDFKPEQTVDWQIGKIANALITTAKGQVQGNAVLDSIDPFEVDPSGSIIGNASAGTVRAVLSQVRTAVPSR